MQLIEGSKNLATSDLEESREWRPSRVESEGIPSHFQLTKPYIMLIVVVAGRAKLDILRFFVIPESWLRSLVETTNEMVNIIGKRRVFEEA